MTAVDLTLFAGFFVAALFSRSNRRGLLWLALLLFSYVLSATYWRSDLSSPELITGLGDAFICFAIFYLGRDIWELWLWRLSQLALLTSIVYLTSNLFHLNLVSHEAYSIVLEVLNWFAILFIGTIAALESKGLTNGRAFDPWVSVFGFVRPVYAKARKYEQR